MREKTNDRTVSGASGRHTWTVQGLINHATAFQPDKAAQRKDSSLCVSQLVDCVQVDGKVVDLQVINGRWASVYVRVSSTQQRSAMSNINAADGYSEDYQLRRNIEWCISKGYAFTIYSDAGITSVYPPDKLDLITELLQTKAARYRKVFDTIWLATGHIGERTSAEVESMIRYRDGHIKAILSGPYANDDERPKQGRPKERAYHRQGLTQLWNDVEIGNVHTVVVTDKSRMFRGADLEKQFLELAQRNGVALHGTEEKILDFDVSDPMQKGMVYVLGCVAEKKLDEVCFNVMKGHHELLRSGRPLGMLPFWLERDKDKRAVLVEGAEEIVQEIIDMFLDGLGKSAISNSLYHDGVKIKGKYISEQMVVTTVMTDAVEGVQEQFGLRWPVLPQLVDAETMSDIRAMREERRDNQHPFGFGGEHGNQPAHIFTGIVHCECGFRCQFRIAPATKCTTGYLACGKRHRGDAEEHAIFPENQLAAFLDGIIPHMERLVDIREMQTDALNRASLRDEEIASLCAQIEKSEPEFEEKVRTARISAETNAAALGIKPGSPAFDSAISALTEALVSSDREAIGKLQARLLALRQEATADRATARLRSKMTDLSEWPNLTDVDKNRVLKGLFEKIVLSRPSPYKKAKPGPDGTVTFYLKNVETPLPPVRMFRGGQTKRALFMQSPAHWLADIFGLPYEPEPEPPPKPKLPYMDVSRFSTFHTFLRRYFGDDPYIKRLANAIMKDKGQPRTRIIDKLAMRELLEERGISISAMAGFNAAWNEYLNEERRKMIARFEAQGHSREVIDAVWERYMRHHQRHWQ